MDNLQIELLVWFDDGFNWDWLEISGKNIPEDFIERLNDKDWRTEESDVFREANVPIECAVKATLVVEYQGWIPEAGGTPDWYIYKVVSWEKVDEEAAS